MKKWYVKTILAVLLVFTLAAGVMVVSNTYEPVKVLADEQDEAKSSISVSGSNTVKISPDIAYVTVGVETFSKDPKTAQQENKEKMDKAYNRLMILGIEKKDIQTVNYSINPRYEWENIEAKGEKGEIIRKGERVLKGYDVKNRVKITVRNLNLVGKVIDITVEEGVNKANSVSFDLSKEKREEKYLEALKGASENAMKKAEMIAEVYGIELGKPFKINEGGSYIPSPVRDYAYSKTAAMGMDEADSVQTPISAGQMEIRANVNVVYHY